MDDPLSAVDAHVGKYLFDKVIGDNGILSQSNATRILVTHQVHLVPDADHIVVMDQGRVLVQGNYDDLAQHGASGFSRLLQNHSKEPDELKCSENDDISDMRFVDRVRSGSVISAGSITSAKTVINSHFIFLVYLKKLYLSSYRSLWKMKSNCKRRN